MAYDPDRYTPAGKRILAEYQAQGIPFDVSTRPYYSCGRINFRMANQQDLAGGGGTIMTLVADSGQEVSLFSYNRGGNMQGAGYPSTRVATLCETNLATAQETNNEDFVIEGMSATCIGVSATIIGLSVLYPGFDAEVNKVFTNGIPYIDLGAHIQAPEVASPLSLHESLWELLKPKISVKTLWDIKDTDILGVLSEFPEGGGKSYLKANGVPSADDILRIPEGYVWRNTASNRDKLFTLTLRLEEPAVAVVTQNLTYPIPGGDPPTFITPSSYNLDFMIRLHGTAFYIPSTN